ncbi:MAG: PorT family protein [Bacteroidaceae bacterium]|nr:PorT family protein [Bacteroidaceae bacterium]
MKKIFFMILLGAMVLPSMAQEFRVGATAGVNVNSPSGDDTGLIGFNVGVKGELGLLQASEGWFMDFSALLSSHGWKSVAYYDKATATSLQWKATPYYLSIPVHVGYKFRCSDKLKLFVSAGPYAGIGLFGKETLTSTLAGKSTTSTVSNNIFADNVHERFDWGLGCRLGAELYGHWQLSVGYDWGMKDINKKNMRYRTLSISSVYVF